MRGMGARSTVAMITIFRRFARCRMRRELSLAPCRPRPEMRLARFHTRFLCCETPVDRPAYREGMSGILMTRLTFLITKLRRQASRDFARMGAVRPGAGKVGATAARGRA